MAHYHSAKRRKDPSSFVFFFLSCLRDSWLPKKRTNDKNITYIVHRKNQLAKLKEKFVFPFFYILSIYILYCFVGKRELTPSRSSRLSCDSLLMYRYFFSATPMAPGLKFFACDFCLYFFSFLFSLFTSIIFLNLNSSAYCSHIISSKMLMEYARHFVAVIRDSSVD